MMIAKIMCGAPNGWFDEASLKDASISIGVDRGALVLVNQGIIPDIAIGDFDSIGECDYQKIQQLCSKVIKLPCEKNETDTEVAIEYAISLGVTEIYIYGAMGGRIDHTLANIRLLLQFSEAKVRIFIVDQTNSLCLLSRGDHKFLRPVHQYISFFAFETTVKGLTLRGLKYPLTNYELTQGDIRCISNEVLADKFSLSFDEGYLLMVNSRD